MSKVCVENEDGSKGLERPSWIYIKPSKDTDPNVLQLQMLESIRNTLEGILAVLSKSEMIYFRKDENKEEGK